MSRTMEEVLADPEIVDLRAAKVAVGDVAPDFELPLLDGSGTVRLSERLPAALVFGSFT